jgi:hypothetical protein
MSTAAGRNLSPQMKAALKTEAAERVFAGAIDGCLNKVRSAEASE